MNRVILSPEYFPNPTIGRPISNADIYVGIVDLDPEIVGNQKQISVQQENGTIVAIAQPISTGAGGVPLYLGSAVTILVDGDYSLKVLDSLGAQIYYVPSQAYLSTAPTNVDDMLGLINISSPEDGDIAEVIGFFVTFPQSAFNGGGQFVWQGNVDKATANGGTIIDPANIGGFDGTSSTLAAFLTAQGGGVGLGCWVRNFDSGVEIEWFGAIGDGVFSENQNPINKALANYRDVSAGVGTFLTTGRCILEFFGQQLKGAGYLETEIKGNSGAFDILEIGSGGFVSDTLIQDIHFNQFSATGGHTILQSIGTAQMVWNRVKLTQKNPGTSLYHKNPGLDYVDNHWSNFTCFHLESATVPSFSLIDPTGGLVNSNSWTDGRMTFSGNYSFWIESGSDSSFQFDNVFKRINFEVCSGGQIKGLGVFNLVIEDNYGYDTPANYVRDVVYIGESTHAITPLKSRFIRITGGGRRSGTLAGGVLDIRLQTDGVTHALLQAGNNGTSTGYSVSLGANTGITVIGAVNWTLTEVNENHVFLSTESGDVGLKIGTTIKYGLHASTANAAYIKAAGGLVTEGPLFIGDSTTQITGGSGSPEGVITANTGSWYSRTDGGGVPGLYVKETGGLSNTGWVAK